MQRMNRCGNCDVPVKDAAICAQDTQNFRLLLQLLPDRLLTMTTTIRRQSVMGTSVGSGGSAETALPYQANAAEKKQQLLAQLISTVLQVKETFSNSFRHTDTDVLCEWLTCMLPEIRLHPDAGRWHSELSKAYADTTRVIDRPVERISVGRCGSKTMAGECQKELIARKGQATIVCPECSTRWDVKERQRNAVTAAWDAIDYPPVIVRALQQWDMGLRVSIKDIKNWVQLGRLEPATLDATGRKMYRVSDVQDVAMAMAARRKKPSRAESF